jgi:hypothetical protein
MSWPAASGWTPLPDTSEASARSLSTTSAPRSRHGSTLSTPALPGLTNLALHLLRDLDVVAAGLTLHWNSGSAEGVVKRIKKIKRQLYGRAGFGLLRKLILFQ